MGALFGAAAWSSYAVVEFVFSSVVFRLTRPYAIFPAWHWSLTALVVIGYVLCGIVLGALSGIAIALWNRRGDSITSPSDSLESVAGLTLVAALVFHQLSGQGMRFGGKPFLAIGVVFLLLLAASLRSEAWRDRLGWLTNSWIIAAIWLGAGLAGSILRSPVASQLGHRLDLAAAGVTAALLIAAASALIIGRAVRRGPSGGQWQMRLNLAACTAAILLIAGSAFLAFGQPAVAGAESGGASSSPRPNLVLIVMDTVRADHLSMLGYQRDTTPHLRELAKDSVTYSHALSAADITLTSHASLFTGMYPSWHGAYTNPPDAMYGMELSPKYPTLAELLKRGGYQTLGVAANLYLRADFGLERGFEEFRIPRPVPMLPDESRYMMRYSMRRGIDYFADTAQFDRLYTLGEDIDREVFATIGNRSRPGDPFFLFVNYMDAHFPYVPPAPYSVRFPGRRWHMAQDDLEAEMEVIYHGQGQPAGYRAHCESQYDGGIAYEDAQIGTIVDWLKRHNAYDNTMIVVTSDHGESFGEKNRVGHANSPYQNLLHVGLLIKYPHSSRRGVEEAPVSLVDVAPTTLTTLNLPVPDTMQGRTLAEGVPAGRRIFAETFISPVMHSPDCPDGCVTKTVVEWPLKFIKNLTNGKPEFFDLSQDPHEQHNLFATQQERAAILRDHLDEWSKDLPKQGHTVKRIDSGIQKGLEGNGYIQK
jgi:arylsulfatase A-like enzyme